jgi:hypothetical protein
MDVTLDFVKQFSSSNIGLAIGSLIFVLAVIREFVFPKKGKFARYGNSHLRAWLTWQPNARNDLDRCTAVGYEKVLSRDFSNL